MLGTKNSRVIYAGATAVPGILRMHKPAGATAVPGILRMHKPV